MPLVVKHKNVGIKLEEDEWVEADLHLIEGHVLTALGDVNVPSPTDGYALAYHAATGLWVAARPTPAAHGPSHEKDGSDEISVADLSGLLADSQRPALGISDWGVFDDFTNWSSLTGGNGGTSFGLRQLSTYVSLGYAESFAKAYLGWLPKPISFDLDISFAVSVGFGNLANNAHAIAAFSQSQPVQDLATDGFAFVVKDNGAVWGQVYDGSLHEVDLSHTAATGTEYVWEVRLYAGEKVEWFIDGASKGSSVDIPSGGGANPYFNSCVWTPAALSVISMTIGRWAYDLSLR